MGVSVETKFHFNAKEADRVVWDTLYLKLLSSLSTVTIQAFWGRKWEGIVRGVRGQVVYGGLFADGGARTLEIRPNNPILNMGGKSRGKATSTKSLYTLVPKGCGFVS